LNFSDVRSEEVYQLSTGKKTEYLGKYFEILLVGDEGSSVKEVISSDNFTKSDKVVPNIGFLQGTPWIKFEVQNNTQVKEWILDLAYPHITEIALYDSVQFGKFKAKTCNFNKKIPQKYEDTHILFDLDLEPGENRVIYMRFKSDKKLILPISIHTKKVFFRKAENRNYINGIFIGVMVVMILYHLAIYLSTRSIIYFHYIIYMFFSLMTQISIMGIYQAFLGQYALWFNEHYIQVFTILVAISGNYFVYNFLKVRTHLPKLRIYFIVLNSVYAASILLAFTPLKIYKFQILDVLGGISVAFLLFTGFKTMKIGYRPARFFLIAWFMFLIGIVLFTMKDLGLLPYNLITNYTMPIGVTLETILLSLAIADRINSLRAEKVAAQKRMLEEIRHNNIMIQDQKNILEEEVDQSARKLEMAGQDLSKTLENLKSTQMQLVESEKMASLGQFTAGIAHEINNPINFVSSNVKPLKFDVEEILGVLQKYKEIMKEKGLDDQFAEAKELEEELDMEYTIGEINELLDGIEIGAKRTAEIVSSLRTFAKAGSDEAEKVDITLGLRSTLTILKSKLKYIDVERNFTELPEIECFVGKLNQVFMNILDNAIYAAEKRWGQTNKGKITLTTTKLKNNVKIEIEDNGIGMSKKDASKIFDPFFTTKEVGKGTGLGLSISYGIIENHNGSIKVDSKIGEGTKFTIILPIVQPEK
jgi:signal transduction histidine kinase